jgi:hypothetical protein
LVGPSSLAVLLRLAEIAGELLDPRRREGVAAERQRLCKQAGFALVDPSLSAFD